MPPGGLEVVFFRTDTGREPVRKWLRRLPISARKRIGEEIKTVQLGWPLGMPLVRKLMPDLWEVRVRLDFGTARVLFTLEQNHLILLHGFIKKRQKTPGQEMDVARRRLAQVKAASRQNR